MCWRDDVVQSRWCSFCGQSYYGDLGHRNCPKAWKKPSAVGLDSSSLASSKAPEQGPHEQKK